MTCPLCGHDEQRERCSWPMPESPASFHFDDELDRDVLASRLSAPDFTKETVADLLHIDPAAVWTYVKRGRLPAPDHYEKTAEPQGRAVWKAEQLVGLVGVR